MTQDRVGGLETRVRSIRINIKHTKRLQRFWKLVEPTLLDVLDGFLTRIASKPHQTTVIENEILHLKQAQAAQWQELFVGGPNAAYYDSVKAVGIMHQRVDLEPRCYIGGYTFVLTCLTDLAVGAYCWSPEKLRFILAALTAHIMFDMDVVISVRREALMVEQQKRDLWVDALLREFERTATVLVDTVDSAAVELRNAARSLTSAAEK